MYYRSYKERLLGATPPIPSDTFPTASKATLEARRPIRALVWFPHLKIEPGLLPDGWLTSQDISAAALASSKIFDDLPPK
jgi:hypothetical protein